MPLISIWLLPSEEDENYFKSIIDDLGQKYQAPSFTPHLTIYGDVTAEPEVAYQATKDSIQEIQPFTLSGDKLNYTDLFFKTVVVEIQENPILTIIYRRLKDKLGQYGEYGLKPHLSLIYKELSEEKKQEIIRGVNVKKDFTVNRIVVAMPGNLEKGWYDIEKWQVLFTERLGNL